MCGFRQLGFDDDVHRGLMFAGSSIVSCLPHGACRGGAAESGRPCRGGLGGFEGMFFAGPERREAGDLGGVGLAGCLLLFHPGIQSARAAGA